MSTSISLCAGPLTMQFEPETSFLRYVKLGDCEVVRGVYAAVRDQNWGTVAPKISNFQSEIDESSFRLSFDVDCTEAPISFFWQGEVTGEKDGTVTYSFKGRATSTFLRNRIGFCVLHPMNECVGVACDVEHSDGTVEKSYFPVHISPHQPFFEMRAITHQVDENIRIEVRFEGEVFEMEDQRNWTDASYKTYCTPLGLPFPVQISAGTLVEQSVTIRPHGVLPQVSGRNTEIVTLEVEADKAQPIPKWGLGMASHEQPLDAVAIKRLKELTPSHLRVDVVLSADYHALWQRAQQEAALMGAGLEVALFVSDNAKHELQQFAPQLSESPIERILVFHQNEKVTTRQWVELARQHLSAYTKAPIGAGTNAYFAELNRQRPPIETLDFVSFSINPQVHAFDNASLAETLEAQSVAVESARHFCGDLPLIVSPVTLQPRFNPNATGPAPEVGPNDLPPQVDVRQRELFGAAWTLGSFKYLAQSEVAAVTYYETSGWRGVLETASGSPVPAKFTSRPSEVFPLYFVFAALTDFKGGEVIASRSNQPLHVESLVLRTEQRIRLLLGNLSATPQTTRVKGLGGRARAKILTSDTVNSATLNPESWLAQAGSDFDGSLELPPYAVAIVDFEEFSFE